MKMPQPHRMVLMPANMSTAAKVSFFYAHLTGEGLLYNENPKSLVELCFQACVGLPLEHTTAACCSDNSSPRELGGKDVSCGGLVRNCREVA